MKFVICWYNFSIARTHHPPFPFLTELCISFCMLFFYCFIYYFLLPILSTSLLQFSVPIPSPLSLLLHPPSLFLSSFFSSYHLPSPNFLLSYPIPYPQFLCLLLYPLPSLSLPVLFLSCYFSYLPNQLPSPPYLLQLNPPPSTPY